MTILKNCVTTTYKLLNYLSEIVIYTFKYMINFKKMYTTNDLK